MSRERGVELVRLVCDVYADTEDGSLGLILFDQDASEFTPSGEDIVGPAQAQSIDTE
jgi:hypothetical protein